MIINALTKEDARRLASSFVAHSGASGQSKDDVLGASGWLTGV